MDNDHLVVGSAYRIAIPGIDGATPAVKLNSTVDIMMDVTTASIVAGTPVVMSVRVSGTLCCYCCHS